MRELEEIFNYIDTHIEEMCGDLETVCSYRSVAGDQAGLDNTRAYIRAKMEESGVEVEEAAIPGGNSIVYGSAAGLKNKTVLFYNHYDVVEEGDHRHWKNGNPFSLYTEDGTMYARGISDNKGALFSRIHAVQAIEKAGFRLPVNVKFLVEGDEETSSPSMFQFARDHKERFQEMVKADVCFWENGRIDKDGHPWARFGVRGNCSFDLKVTTCNADLHGRMGSTVPSASWRLIWALASIKGPDEKVMIRGFYDDVQEPTEEELLVLEKFPYEEEQIRKRLNLNHFLLGATGEELKKMVYLTPSVSVCGLEAGELYNGPRGIVPHTAFARISFYLVANQSPEKIYHLLREHLDSQGFEDVEIIRRGGSAPVKTPTDIPLRDQLIRAAKEVYCKEMVIEPTQLGAGPAIAVRDACKDIPIIGIGPGNTGSNHHAPNENLTIEDYKNAVKYIAAVLYSF